jgi:predicted alpha/beta hydrolase family esterase
LGCLTVAKWANSKTENTDLVQAALLVAPPDAEASADMPEFMRRFMSDAVLPFPSILVGSNNDHYTALAAAQHLARLWGSRFVNAGAVGHINTESGHGYFF